MKFERPKVQGVYPWERIEVSPPEYQWHINPIKRWIYLNFLNWFNRAYIWRYFGGWIEL